MSNQITFDKGYFTNKKIRLTFILSILVFTIHIPSLANYDLNNTMGEYISIIAKVISSISCMAVPLFFIISGALFYRDYDIKKTMPKLKSRFFSLVLPYLCWNTIWMLFSFVCSYTPISKFFIAREKVVISAENILNGIFLYKFTPFWFIFCLIVFSLLCPIIYPLIKNKYLGPVVILVVYILRIYGIELPDCFFRSDCIIYYLVGGYIGANYFDIFANRSNRKISVISIFICIGCAAFNYFSINNIIPIDIDPIIYIIFSIAFWLSMDIFQIKHVAKFEKNSFLIYAMHVNVGAIVCKLLYFILPKYTLFACVNYILTIVATVIIISVFNNFVKKYIPTLAKMLGCK